MKEEAVGIVAFSFALREAPLEPNPANAALASETVAAVERQPCRTFVVAQWEVARALERSGHPADHVVRPSGDGRYLDSTAVWREAAAILTEQGISAALPVAKPGLHLLRVRSLVRTSGFRLVRTPIGKVPYDRSPLNHQWWTKGPLRLLAYSVRQALKGLGAASTTPHRATRGGSDEESVHRRDVDADVDQATYGEGLQSNPRDSDRDPRCDGQHADQGKVPTER